MSTGGINPNRPNNQIPNFTRHAQVQGGGSPTGAQQTTGGKTVEQQFTNPTMPPKSAVTSNLNRSRGLASNPKGTFSQGRLNSAFTGSSSPAKGPGIMAKAISAAKSAKAKLAEVKGDLVHKYEMRRAKINNEKKRGGSPSPMSRSRTPTPPSTPPPVAKAPKAKSGGGSGNGGNVNIFDVIGGILKALN